ncbi:uncharacterized protein PSFLO_01040 [Pseudozyma flocculosa]|uniref:Uncharacterized protein n=1 Tax=Pseudozyma flocculosa TaxID=84751 RepID=A0A5C3EWN6_9BASI|nr:uncharacterized protein PSFLO_01040 [Pseudozyma flocculosa]
MSASRPPTGVDGLVQNASASSSSTVRDASRQHVHSFLEIDDETAAEVLCAARDHLTMTSDSSLARPPPLAPRYNALPAHSPRGLHSLPASGPSTPPELHHNGVPGHQSDGEVVSRRPTGFLPPLFRLTSDDVAIPDQPMADDRGQATDGLGPPPPPGHVPMGWSSSQTSNASSDTGTSAQTAGSGYQALGGPPQFDLRLQPPPPGYHTHDFPPTPPAIDFAGNQPSPFNEAFQRQLQLQDAYSPPPPPDHPPPPIDAGPGGVPGGAAAGGGGGRFPRWRGWLEKRALERHYARMDAAAGASTSVDANGNLLVQPPIRKKSWGTGVNDPDAVEDDLDVGSSSSDDEDGEDGWSPVDPGSLPPLHVHHYGSRFIPHLHSQPLCSVLLELPPAPPLPGHQQAPRGAQSSTGSSSQEAAHARIEEAKCIHVWSGLGIYQMCVLSSNEPVSSPGPFASAARSGRGASGILLALTAPTTAVTSSYLPKPLVQLSAHAGTVFESVTTSASGGPGSSSNSSHGHGASFPDGTEGIAAANFGCAAGGGPGRAVPPGGTGSVRMWNLEALRKVLLYALDHEAPKLPMDLVGERTASKEKKNTLAAILKRTFAKEKSKGDRHAKSPGHSRRGTSDGVGTIDPLPSDLGTADSRRSSPRLTARALDDPSDRSSFRPSLDLGRETSRASFQSDSFSVESFAASSTKDDRDGASLLAKDPDLATALALALSSVPISAPTSSASAPGQSAQGSYTSLFGADAYGPAAAKHASGKGKDRDHSASATGRGVLFFTVHEAGPDTKGSGTWYLALATSKSVMVYEAVPAKRGGGRSWAWMKELYAPFAIKAVAFAPALVADSALASGSPTSSGGGAVSASMKLKVSSADAPLSASPKGAGHGGHNAKRPLSGYSSILKPYHSLASAAPSSWHRADLCVMVSFGRRSVVIRLSDSNVREFELMPLADVVAAAPGNGSLGQSHLALLPQVAGPTASPSSKEKAPRPRSIISLGLGPTASNTSSAGATRSNAGHERQRENGTQDLKSSSKHNWVGFTALQAQIRVRQHIVDAEPTHSRSRSSVPPGAESFVRSGAPPRPASYAQPLARPLPQVPGAREATAAQREKELPRPPPPQSLSFDRRASRQYLDDASRRAYEAVQAESSSSGSDDDYGPSSVPPARGYSLHDTAPNRPGASGGDAQGARGGRSSRQPLRRSSSTPDLTAGTNLVSVRMALVSRGSITQVLPLPLPVDLARPLPLAALQWSDTPNSVSGWARVLGVERARSSGPVSVDHLRSGARTAGNVGGGLSSSRPQLISRNSSSSLNKGNVLGIHVGITAVAFLPSRIEMKRVSFKTEAVVNFDLHRNAELELVPLVPLSDYQRPAGPAMSAQAEQGHPPSMPRAGHTRSRNSIFGSDSAAGGCWQAPASRSMSRPVSTVSTSTAHSTAADSSVAGYETAWDAATAEEDADARAWSDVELEYLCGNLLTVSPIDLDASAAGSEAAVFRLSGQNSEGTTSPGQVLRELAGDGGIVAYDWRGAEDYRIFCVGAQG